MNTATGLTWFEEGYGFLEGTEIDYGKEYFQKYEGYEETDIGKKINQSRLDLVNTFTGGKVLDVGIGSGTFVKGRANTYGYDVNPCGIEWLKKEGKWFDPYEQIPTQFEAITFFDSLEHIREPYKLLQRLSSCYVISSIPCFTDKEHVLRSKHFKPNEHFWYFTEEGFKWYMDKFGFDFIMQTCVEQWCGREDIKTFVFRKDI
jgi:hypothetical protein